MDRQEIINTMILTKIHGVSLSNMRILYDTMGSATAIIEHRKELADIVPDTNPRLINAFKDISEATRRAESEMEYIDRNRITPLCFNDDAFPDRLKECHDSPLVLYYCGNADLNKAHIISMVGTRKCTEYGKDICRNFIADLKRYYPDTIIVSGLAYGIDINAHRAALDNDMETIGVLAHGLDKIYPSVHRQTAAKMASHGGLITEFMSGTVPEKGNFIRRNRIIAGLCDATIVVESAEKGGSLVTADIASSYNRDVMAFPGRLYDQYSEGCNRLIREHNASLIRNAEDFINSMCWHNPLKEETAPKQLELFDTLTPEQQKIVDVLSNVDDKQINQISVETNISVSHLSALLFDLELNGVISVIGGGRYRLRRS